MSEKIRSLLQTCRETDAEVGRLLVLWNRTPTQQRALEQARDRREAAFLELGRLGFYGRATDEEVEDLEDEGTDPAFIADTGCFDGDTTP